MHVRPSLNYWYSYYSLQGTQGSSGSGSGDRGLHRTTEPVGGCDSGPRQVGRVNQEKEKLAVQVVSAFQWQEHPSTGYGSIRCKANSSEATERVTPVDPVQRWKERLGRVYKDGIIHQKGATRSVIC